MLESWKRTQPTTRPHLLAEHHIRHICFGVSALIHPSYTISSELEKLFISKFYGIRQKFLLLLLPSPKHRVLLMRKSASFPHRPFSVATHCGPSFLLMPVLENSISFIYHVSYTFHVFSLEWLQSLMLLLVWKILLSIFYWAMLQWSWVHSATIEQREHP